MKNTNHDKAVSNIIVFLITLVLSGLVLGASIFCGFKCVNAVEVKEVSSSEDFEHETDVSDIELDSQTESESQDSWASRIKNYADVVLGVTISVSIALASITATIFIFSKSSLDRINDENEHVAEVVNIHKRNNLNALLCICIMGIILIVLPIGWHVIFSFTAFQFNIWLRRGIILLIIQAILYLSLCVYFWYRCIVVESLLLKIILNKCNELKMNVRKMVLKDDQNDKILAIIGDWFCWEDKSAEQYKEEGRKLCSDLNADRYISLFEKAEKLLLSKDYCDKAMLQDSNIITLLQERKDLLFDINSVEHNDMENRRYITKDGTGIGVYSEMNKFEKELGLNNDERFSNSNESFFDTTKSIYELLKSYRNLLISERYTKQKVSEKRWERINNKGDYPESPKTIELFARVLYYFFIRILAAFVSSVQINEASLNGCSLNYANFYSSTLNNLTLYSADCFRTIFSRSNISTVIFDISRLEEIDFFGTKIEDTSFSNSTFERVTFERSLTQKGIFNSCEFENCKVLDSIFDDCDFNNTVFSNALIVNSTFSRGRFKDVHWKEKTSLSNCILSDSIIQSWSAEDGFKMENCDFARSIWSDISIKNWHLSGSIFERADLSSIEMTSAILVMTSFSHSLLSNANFVGCNFTQATLEGASLLDASFEHVELPTTNMGGILAVNASFDDCNMEECNSADGDFSNAKFSNCTLTAARFYDATLIKATIEDCRCEYLLADHLQFTFATCQNSNFSFGSMSDSNFTKTRFTNCQFTGIDLSSAIATQTVFADCCLENIDFSDSRFYKTEFIGQQRPLIIKKCNFTNCKFEQVKFENVIFDDCIYNNTVFAGCISISKKTRTLRKKDVVPKCRDKNRNATQFILSSR